MTLDPLSEIAELQTENDCLRERLKIAEEKLQNSLRSTRDALSQIVILQAQFELERVALRRELSETEALAADLAYAANGQ